MGVVSHFISYKLGLKKAQTYYSDEACARLEYYANEKKCLAEVGCWHGVNTARIRSVMHPEATLYAIDPYPKGRLGFSAPQKIAHEEVNRIENGKVVWMEITGDEAAEKMKEEKFSLLDFIFIDADNTYQGFESMWKSWVPLVQSGGIMILANSYPASGRGIEGAGSVKFTEEIILKDPMFDPLEFVETFTILKKK